MTWVAFGDEQNAISSLQATLANRAESKSLYRAFDSAELAAAHIRNGDIDEGVQIGHRSLDLAEQMASVRARRRLAPLRAAVALGGRSAAELADRLNRT